MTDVNTDQRAFWNSDSATKWVALEEDLGAMHGNITRALIAAAAIGAGERVLDIGCGTGASSRAAARAAGERGQVTAVDISHELLDRARVHGVPPGGAPIDYLLADAQVHGFPARHFDRVISQIGIMFFEDPVAGFRNLLAATRPGGRIAFVCWRRGEDNFWFTKAREIAVSHLGDAPSDPDAPGPLAFADEARVTTMLATAGWQEPQAKLMPLDLTPRGGPAETALLSTRMGPAARLIREYQPEPARIDAIAEEIAALLKANDTPEGLRIPVVMNRFTATAPG